MRLVERTSPSSRPLSDAARRRAYIAKVNEIRRTALNLESGQVRQVFAFYRQALRDIRVAISDARGWELIHLQEIERGVNAAVAEFVRKYSESLGSGIKLAFSNGSDSVDKILSMSGVRVPITDVDPTMVNVLSRVSADLVKNIGEDLLNKVNTEIRMGLMGGRSVRDVKANIAARVPAVAVTRTIGGKKQKVMIGPAARAEMIARTEMNRAWNIGTQAKHDELAKREYLFDQAGIVAMKTWVATMDNRTRPEHLEAHGKTVGLEDDFKVGGELLAYPMDPRGSAENTINCRCRAITVTELKEMVA